MSRYNVYKIKNGQTNGLQAHLTDERHYVRTSSFVSNGYEVSIYFSDAQPTEIWWLDQYSLYFGDHANEKNAVFSGAVVAKKNTGNSGYVIPLGKTHFYIQDYVELSFGLELAERIADDKQTKMKSLKNFGGKTSKALVSYNSESSLVFASCESAEYIKLKASHKEKWGDAFIHFGTSVQFNSSEVLPSDLGNLLTDIDIALAQTPRFNLPLMKEVDSQQAGQLYAKLAQKISSLNQAINFLDYEIYGVDFVFAQQTHVRLKYDQSYSEPLSDLTLEPIVAFATANNINLAESLSQIKTQVLIGGESKYTLPLIRLMEYHDDETRCFLFHGKWFHFNQSFIDSLHRGLGNVAVEHFALSFSEAEFIAWEAVQTERVRYRERFVLTKINETLGYEIIDRTMDYQHTADKKYPIEVGDLHDAELQRIIVVKIGEPHDFSYAFDQTFAMLSNVQGHQYITSTGVVYPLKEVEVLLVFKSERELRSATDTGSIIFEIKLNELQKLAQEKDVRLKLSHTTIL